MFHHDSGYTLWSRSVFSHMLNRISVFLGQRVEHEGSPYLNDVKTIQRTYETPIANRRLADSHSELESER